LPIKLDLALLILTRNLKIALYPSNNWSLKTRLTGKARIRESSKFERSKNLKEVNGEDLRVNEFFDEGQISEIMS
jgi:hypothetical protein